MYKWTSLGSSVPTDDRDTLINCYNLIRASHPNNNKRGGVCLYYRESPAVQLVETNYLSECLLCEVTINDKKGYVVVLYRSPSQNSLEFDNFILNFEMMLSDINFSNPHFSIILGDFNARSNNWWQDDTQTSEGSRIDYPTTSYGFQQLTSERTHILKNSSFCIDLIVTDKPNLITDSGTHPSLHPNCHHNISFVR